MMRQLPAWNSYGIRPNGIYHNWDLRIYTVEEILNRTREIISRTRKIYNDIASTKTLSYDTILRPLLEVQRYSFAAGSLVTFPRHVSESQRIRDAAVEATRLLDEANVEMSMRKDVFDKLVDYKDQFCEADKLTPEYARCLDHMIRNGKRNGLHLDEKVRNQIKTIKKRMTDLQLQFTRNLAEEESFVLFQFDELDGMPYSFFESLKVDPVTKKYIVTMKPHHFFPITRKCRIPNTRRIMENYYQSKCLPENTTLLEEILELRHQEAELLGYDNHAAFTQDVLMAKDPHTVKMFLLELTKKLKPLWELEKKRMLELKKVECERFDFAFNNKIEFWDFRYYVTLVEEEMFTVIQDEVTEYFPLENVTRRMLRIFEKLLHLKFTLLPNAQRWNEDVVVYRVNDADEKTRVGYIYLDLYPRPGKFGHACCVPLQMGCLDACGRRQCSVVAMLTNFGRPKLGKPSLLDHKEVEQYFHEFGHLMHTVCSKAQTAFFFGTRVETDFVEAPSQVFENWVWHPDVLGSIACHYATRRPMPADLMEKLIMSRSANAAALNLRQIVLAIFDQQIHSGGRCDTQEVYAKILKDVMGIDAIPGTNMSANFNHLCVGYSGRYYSYLWSEVFSMDMYKSTFESCGCMDPEVGRRYRRCILEPGGSIDALDMLRTFLGREPSNDAFLESKGLLPIPTTPRRY